MWDCLALVTRKRDHPSDIGVGVLLFPTPRPQSVGGGNNRPVEGNQERRTARLRKYDICPHNDVTGGIGGVTVLQVVIPRFRCPNPFLSDS